MQIDVPDTATQFQATYYYDYLSWEGKSKHADHGYPQSRVGDRASTSSANRSEIHTDGIGGLISLVNACAD